MTIPSSLRLLLAAPVVCVSLSGGAGGALPGTLLTQVDFDGGSPDDEAFARVAASLIPGQPVSEASLQQALAAIRLTDRFRKVEGSLLPWELGVRARIHLDPWPPLERLVLEGLTRGEMSGMRRGDRIGALRLESWRRQFQVHLQETGYPLAQVRCERILEDRGLRLVVSKGAPALVARVAVEGRFAPYTPEQLIKLAKVKPGKTLWTAASTQEILLRLHHRLISDKRYECQTDLAWEDGLLRLTVDAGPVVRLRAEGDSVGWTVSLKDMVPLTRTSRYSPEILNEGDRRILRILRGKGFLDAEVSHRREVLRTGPQGPEEVRVTFTVHRGRTSPIAAVHFEGNQQVPEAELKKAADLPFSLFSPGGPDATPELMDGVESRVKAYYLNHGYTEATVRLEPLRKDGRRNDLVYRVYEGPRRLVRYLKLDLPAGGLGDPWGLGECLTRVLSDKPLRVAVGLTRRYASDIPALAGVEGTLASMEDASQGEATVLTFTLSRPIPLLKGDVAKVFNALRQQRLPALGVVRPVVRLAIEDGADGCGVHLVVPPQSVEQVERLVVQGSDKTRARAVLRETQLNPGAPMDLSALSRVQARLSYLGAFQRVELGGLGEPGPDTPAPGAKDGPPVPWKQGDLLLHLEERPPYIITNSFGYDNTQGYHFGSGIQWLDVGGMGRTVDIGARAGDGTIDNPTLRNWFPTGPYVRSVDSFSVGYADPWFDPGALDGWLADRTALAMEGAYIQERRSLYLLHRRRFTTSLQWLLSPKVSLQAGYRFERVDTAAAVDDISSHTLSVLCRYPQDVTISAPYVQIARDTRDNALDPTRGSYSVARLELANQLFLTSHNASFVKVDLRQQWTWPIGDKAKAGVVALGVRVGLARPTSPSAQDLPLSERFFAGGSFTQRGVEPDGLGPLTSIPLFDPSNGKPETDAFGNQLSVNTPLGGQGLALVNLEYRFPMFSKTVWGELFVDSGQVYSSLTRLSSPVLDVNGVPLPQNPPFRTSVGFGIIFKLAIPIKLEYAADIKRLLGEPRNPDDFATQLKGISISAGFSF